MSRVVASNGTEYESVSIDAKPSTNDNVRIMVVVELLTKTMIGLFVNGFGDVTVI